MPLLNNNNDLTVAIKTTSDNIGIASATAAVENYAGKLEVVRQKLIEASQADNVKTSTMTALQNTQKQYEQQFDIAIQKQDLATMKQQESTQKTDEAASSSRGLAGAVLLGQAAYNALYDVLQKGIGLFTSSIDSANKYQLAIAGLNSTSRAMNDNVSQATQAAQKLSSDGLMPVTQSATALRNLLAAGFSLPQAIQLMDSLKDKLAFNRQGYDNMGDAVVHASKGIELGNSKMLEATGVNEKLNSMLKDAGVKTSDLGNLQGSAAARQAILNGVVKNASGNLGDAAKASEIFGAKQAAAGTAVENLKIGIGGIEQLIGGPLLQAFTTFLSTNQRMIIDFGAASIVAVGLGLALFGVVKAIQMFSLESLIAAATNPLLLLLTTLAVLAGVVVFNAIDKLQSKVKDMNAGLGTGADNTKNLKNETDDLTKAQQDLADKLAKIDEQMAKNNRDFQQQLADTNQGIKDKATGLQQQLDQEDKDFAKSQAKQLDSFKNTQDTITDSHQKQVNKIQKNLNDELALGKWADQSKLADLRQQLADENSQYDEQMAEKQATYTQDVADAQDAHSKKTTDLQSQLDAENTLLKKHAADVASVQNVTMLDEIDKIKQTHDDQIKAFDDQKAQAIKSSQETNTGILQNYDDLTKQLGTKNDTFAGLGKDMGKAMGNALKDALVQSLTDTGKGLYDFFNGIYKGTTNFVGKALTTDNFGISPSIMNDFKHRALGGHVSAGQPSWVGDNPDGSLNSTSELFVPDTSGTILSAKDSHRAMGGSGGVTINQVNHIYNQMDLKAANVELGWRMANV